MKEAFQYSIIKYIDNIIRDEHINVGIVIFSKNDSLGIKSILDYEFKIINGSYDSKILLTRILKKLINVISESKDSPEETVKKMSERFNRIRLTELRGIVYEDKKSALNYLFNRFIHNGNFAIQLSQIEYQMTNKLSISILNTLEKVNREVLSPIYYPSIKEKHAEQYFTKDFSYFRHNDKKTNQFANPLTT